MSETRRSALGGVKRVRERSDEDLDRLRALLTAWADRLGSEPLTIADAIQRAGGSGDPHDALAAYSTGRPEAKPIGNALRKLQGRVVGDLVLRRDGVDRKGIVRWAVITCG